ncbi:MAG: DUF5018 domain-containing protein [Ruminococcus flavefaciens]|nr:DUF5018 domain-containing protein [Ruminococcus flavefaciens]
MKLKYILYAATVGVMMGSLTACDDDMTADLRSDANIESFGFTVSAPAVYDPEDPTKEIRAAKTFKVKPDANDPTKFYVCISPFLDASEYLTNCRPQFYLSMGATVNPPMTESQDFSHLDAPVEYTVTSGDGKHTKKFYVSWKESEMKAVGEGIGDIEEEACKTYVELGYPGTFGTWPAWKSEDLKTSMGDLMCYPAFCGTDKLVLFSRRYAWGDDGQAGAKYQMAANPSLAIKVFDVETLTPNGALNLGSINVADIVAIASDFKGNMVAAVGRKSAGQTDFYYWTSIDADPVHIGTAPITIDISLNDTDASPYINVAGDITINAAIATSAPRTDRGHHYKFYAYRGVLEPNYEDIYTEHTQLDLTQFQMISYFGSSENDPYLVGDCEPNGAETNGHVKIYLNNPDGSNRASCDYHPAWYNGATMSNGDAWWSRSGTKPERTGSRRPTVYAMILNGQSYSFFLTGTDQCTRGLFTNQELNEQVAGALNFDNMKQCKDKSNGKDMGSWQMDSFGAVATWYFDDEAQQGRVITWADRWGVNSFLITCYE